MCGPVVSFVMQAVVLVNGAQTYDEAYVDTQTSGKPLVVLVGADWCPSCVTMKSRILPRMQSSGRLRQVNFAHIDADRDEQLAAQVMRGGAIPQLIVFSRGADGNWHREYLVGATSEEAVAAAIERAVQRAGAPSQR